MSIINSGLITAQQAQIYNNAVMAGLENSVTAVTDVVAEKIALTRPVVLEGSDANPLGRKIPATMFFPFAPPTAQAESLIGQDRPFHPLVRNTATVKIGPYGTGYYVYRKDFFNDIFYTLSQVPKILARAMMKLPDVQLASLLRNGKTTLDYTNTFAFSTSKPISVNGVTTGTYSNLYTSRSLTSINLGFVISEMMSRLNEDGLSLGLQPDTLIVPPNLYQAAKIATSTRSIVFGSTALNQGNLAPGQPINTAAQGDNWLSYDGPIKQVIVMPELTTGNQAIDQTTWYVAECMNMNHGGAVGLLLAVEPGFEFLTNISPQDPEVFYKNRFAWGAERYLGTDFGNTAYMSRCEA